MRAPPRTSLNVRASSWSSRATADVVAEADCADGSGADIIGAVGAAGSEADVLPPKSNPSRSLASMLCPETSYDYMS